MHELPPILKTVQKPVRNAVAKTSYAARRNAAAEASKAKAASNAPQKAQSAKPQDTDKANKREAVKLSDNDQVKVNKATANKTNANAETNNIDAEFTELLADVGMIDEQLPVENESVVDAGLVETQAQVAPLPVAEMANAQLAAIHLNSQPAASTETDTDILATEQVVEVAETPQVAAIDKPAEDVSDKPVDAAPNAQQPNVEAVKAAEAAPVAAAPEAVKAETANSDKVTPHAAAAKSAPAPQKVETAAVEIAAKTAEPKQVETAEPKISTEPNVANTASQVSFEQLAEGDAALPVKSLSKLFNQLQNLARDENGEPIQLPELVHKALSRIEALFTSANKQGLAEVAEKIAFEIGQLLNQDQPLPDGKLKDILGKMLQMLTPKHDVAQAKMTMAATSDETTVPLASNDNGVKPENKSEMKSLGHKLATGESHGATPQANAQAQTQMHVELSKYADRYGKNQNAETANLSQDESAADDEPMAANRMASIYNGVKSSLERGQKASNIMSALDKMNKKSPMDFLNQMQSNQRLDPTQQDNNIQLKLAMNNGRLAQNLPLNSMAFQMGKQFSRGNSEFQIRLDPAELGKINVKLTVKQGGNVKAHMVVERNDVFELMQRDARALERALTDAGFDGKNVEIELTLDQNASQGGTFAENFFDEPQAKSGQNSENDANGEDEIENLVASHIPAHVTSGGIDRKI